MGRIHVVGADLSDDQVAKLRVRMHNLPARTIDRDTALSWARDGHSFITTDGQAIQLVEIDGDEPKFFLRLDNKADAKDDLGELPSVAKAN